MDTYKTPKINRLLKKKYSDLKQIFKKEILSSYEMVRANLAKNVLKETFHMM